MVASQIHFLDESFDCSPFGKELEQQFLVGKEIQEHHKVEEEYTQAKVHLVDALFQKVVILVLEVGRPSISKGISCFLMPFISQREKA